MYTKNKPKQYKEYSYMKKVKYLSLLFLIFTLCCSVPGKVKTGPGKGNDYIFYPPLPEASRYQYLKTFSTSADVKKKKSKFFRFVAGAEQEKPMAIRKAYGVEIYAGVMYVCDFSSGVVMIFDIKNRSFGYFGQSGSVKLLKPINLKIDKENRIVYVADMGRKQVVAFTLKGKHVKSFGKEGQFSPSDVDLHENKLFICDVKGHMIHVLDKDSGETMYTFGKPGSSEGELFHPTNICIRDERLYISETTNFRVSIFDLQGKFVTMFGELGKQRGNFTRNKGVAVDREGRIYVVDAAFQNVQVFNPEFKLLLFFLSGGLEKHNVYLPAGIAIDYDNIEYFKGYIHPKFKAEYLLFVTSNFGLNKVNVYAFGSYRE
ncbi:MAG: hypothetical protein KAT34_06515 [Candidatus Aminicenantes bacterium]|nr:hypothetical protein [Candidatus Aminicenantes bacterium]